jgi:cell wall assembly regulator SMI1
VDSAVSRWDGNHIGLDFDPDTLGTVGQVIRFGRDEDEKVFVAPTFGEFLDQLVSALRASGWDGEEQELTWP